ncbi:MAG: nitrile hydratase subunit beta [Aestuariivirga sp.]
MDGIHDLGGKHGFGPIPIGQDENPFHFDWEKRMWALARSGIAPGITIDWFRHGIERMVPSDYLAFPYFKRWCTTYLMLLIDGETITMQEALAGHVDNPAEPATAKSLDDALASNRRGHFSFEVATDVPPRLAVGDTVITKRITMANHTRLPAYARTARGKIIAHHGAHLLPDKGAQGVHQGEHLYTVSFTACELWGEDANPLDSVRLELWESYLVPT